MFNALIETEEREIDYGNCFDSISICLSKGLGAPVGSLLLGNADFIKKARRIRKILGGGMRQTGYLAAAGLYALQNNVTRLKEDHLLAQEIGKLLNEQPFVEKVSKIETNIIIFEHSKTYQTEELLNKLNDLGIRAVKMGQSKIRFVTHLNLPENTLELVKIALSKMV